MNFHEFLQLRHPFLTGMCELHQRLLILILTRYFAEILSTSTQLFFPLAEVFVKLNLNLLNLQ